MNAQKLPNIKEIVERRYYAGIAAWDETMLYLKGDLDDEEYSDDFKRKLLAEVEEAEQKMKAQPKEESNADWLTPKLAAKK